MTQSMTSNQAAIIESILFAAGEPVALSELASLLSCTKPELRSLLEAMQADAASRGIRPVWDTRVAQLVTAPDTAPFVARYLQTELRGALSQSALETLAIIAYRGPATRPQIEAIRGVQSAAAVRTLTIRGLITDVGRSNTPGRPIRYQTTVELLKQLGIQSAAELPPIPEELLTKLAARAPQDELEPTTETA